VYFPDCTSDVASEFANYFKKVYDQVNNGETISDTCIHDEPTEVNNDNNFCSFITAEQLDSCISKLHLQKAAGPYDLVARTSQLFMPIQGWLLILSYYSV
jgi:hypothetical protein